jgi:hypothetical protein
MEVLLHGASRLGDTPLVRELLSALLATGAEPSAATYRAVLHAQGEDATLAGRWACVWWQGGTWAAGVGGKPQQPPTLIQQQQQQQQQQGLDDD